jgi:hypothetical protein
MRTWRPRLLGAALFRTDAVFWFLATFLPPASRSASRVDCGSPQRTVPRSTA